MNLRKIINNRVDFIECYSNYIIQGGVKSSENFRRNKNYSLARGGKKSVLEQSEFLVDGFVRRLVYESRNTIRTCKNYKILIGK